MINEQFEQIRKWAEIRGVGGQSNEPIDKRLQSQMQRVFQEVIEIHDAIVKEDWEEFQDALGDTVVTLVNVAKIKNYNLEDCIDCAFDVIKLRKGITTENGEFIRYNKLSDEYKKICDEKQGNEGNQYFAEDMLNKLSPKDFKL